MPWIRWCRSLGKTGTPWSAYSRSIKRWMHYLRSIVLWQSNGSNRWIDRMPCIRWLKMNATTNDSLRHTNGNSTAVWWFPSTWWPESKIPRIRIQTCSTFGWTTMNSIWRTIEWKCIQMAAHRPWWCPEWAACKSIGLEFDVGFGLYALDAPTAAKREKEKDSDKKWVMDWDRGGEFDIYSFSKSKVCAYECQWHRHTEPQGEQRNQRTKWHRTWATFAPKHQIHDEK